MGLNKIIANLQKILDRKKSQQLERIDALQDLLERLRKKEQKYAERLEQAESPDEEKSLKQRIKVCRAQLEKGERALEDLQKKVAADN